MFYKKLLYIRSFIFVNENFNVLKIPASVIQSALRAITAFIRDRFGYQIISIIMFEVPSADAGKKIINLNASEAPLAAEGILFTNRHALRHVS